MENDGTFLSVYPRATDKNVPFDKLRTSHRSG